MANITEFDKTEIYEEIAPIVKQLDLALKSHGIPYIFGACLKNSEEGSDYVYEGNFCGSNGLVLKDDKITDFLRILCGFRVRTREDEEGGYSVSPPDDEFELEFVE